MSGLPIDPNEPRPITTAELDEIRARAVESGNWSEYHAASSRPRLVTREELDAMLDAFRKYGPGKAANHDRNW